MSKLYELTLDYLHSVLSYDQETGVFRWKITRGRCKKGAIAGSFDPTTGYIRIGVCGADYWAHILAWFYVMGRWPKHQIDHRNLTKTDNSFDNLREATSSQQMANVGICSKNTSGAKGVSFDKKRFKFHAYIKINKRRKHLGYFDNADDAALAYKAAADLLFGEFARAA